MSLSLVLARGNEKQAHATYSQRYLCDVLDYSSNRISILLKMLHPNRLPCGFVANLLASLGALEGSPTRNDLNTVRDHMHSTRVSRVVCCA